MNFFFQALSYIVLIIFFLTLPHKMIGPEILVASQIVYLSNCFYSTSSLYSLVTKQFTAVTGGWDFFASAVDEDVLPTLSGRA